MQTKFINKSMIKASSILVLFLAFFSCTKDIHPELGPYNLDVVLFGQGKNFISSGLIKFRQDPDTARIIKLNTHVFNLTPNHSYLLQRAVNPITDSSCSSTAWLTLGKGLQPQAIHTDELGSGEVILWRDVTAIARGTSFHIHFQVVDSTTLTPVLASGCYDYTVR